MAPPLDKQVIVVKSDKASGALDKVPALHPTWKEDRCFVVYKALPVGVKSGAIYQEWLERLSLIEEDLKWLLKLSHQKFWCQVIFDETLQACLDSCLRQFPRKHDNIDSPSSAIQKLKTVSRLVFMTYLRMSTHKESKASHITPEVFGEILYENYIFDIPKLMDLCVLYTHGNSQLLSKMILNIFACQPKYEDDLAASVQTVSKVFENVEERCCFNRSPNTIVPLKLEDSASMKTLTTMSETDFCDIIFYLLDTAATLQSFLEVYPPACKSFHVHSFCVMIANFYESVTVSLRDALKQRTFSSEDLKVHSKKCLRQAKNLLVQLFRQILYTCCLQSIIENSSDSNQVEDYIEDYLSVLSTIIGERRFLGEYQSLFPFDDDRDILSQAAYSVDDARLQFIEDGILDAYSVYGKKSKLKTDSQDRPSVTSIHQQQYMGAMAAEVQEPSASVREPEGACAPSISCIELESLIFSVKDLLPDYGEGFIKLCLEELNYDVEKVINCILEERIPPSMQNVDKNLDRSPVVLEDDTSQSALAERANIYDNDEFDVFTRDSVDTSKVHRGKKEKISSNLLDEKESILQHKSLYDIYGTNIGSAYDQNLYDDEYDDTYDTNEIGADDADSADELTQRRPFQIPRVLGGRVEEDTESEDDLESEDQVATEGLTRNSADLKGSGAIPKGTYAYNREHKKVLNGGARNKFSDTGKQNDAKGQPKTKGEKTEVKYDVKGQSKGRGQTSDVLRNRQFKEKQKSSRANHNRKNMADKKRMKGMIPS